MADLNLWLDSYNDIYSDFDNRNYSRRRISDDFLHELRMELKNGVDSSDMLLLLPHHERLEEQEKHIAASLHNLFDSRYRTHEHQCRKKKKNILWLFLGGITVILINSWMSYTARASFFVTGLRVLLEPAGWFMIWAAFDFLFYDFPELKKEREFYKTLSKMRIQFKSS